MASNPLFWVTMVTGPIFAANVTWRAFEAGFGLGGPYVGPNWSGIVGGAWKFLNGGGISVGPATASATVLGQTGGVSLASATGLDSQGFVTQAGYTEAAAVDRYGLPVSDDPALDAYIEGAISGQSLSSSAWMPLSPWITGEPSVNGIARQNVSLGGQDEVLGQPLRDVIVPPQD